MSNVTTLKAAAERSLDDRIIDAFVGWPIYQIKATENKIEVSIGPGKLLFFAESDCCDTSWFVLSDIETVDLEAKGKWPNVDRAIFLGYDIVSPKDVGLPEQEVENGSVTFMVQVRTSRGTYTARMANDHGESGYYSGSCWACAIMGYTDRIRTQGDG